MDNYSHSSKSLQIGGTCTSSAEEITIIPPLILRGWGIKIAAVFDEDLVEGEVVQDPEQFIARVKAEYPNADIVTFAQKVPDLSPKWQYPMEWEDMAAIPLTSFNQWWEGLSWKRRRDVRRAEKRGVTVKASELDEAFVCGIKRIYDEAPVRQGKRFWHYGKNLDTIRNENSTYLERSQCIGAYIGEELIGFIRMVYVGRTATILQILSMLKHADKCPTNALIAKAVEIATEKGVTHLIYAKYVCSNRALMDFKRHNGFEQVLYPRYYVPISALGSLALKLNLHKGIKEILPKPVITWSLKLRRHFCELILLNKNRNHPSNEPQSD